MLTFFITRPPYYARHYGAGPYGCLKTAGLLPARRGAAHACTRLRGAVGLRVRVRVRVGVWVRVALTPRSP